ncbi:MAG: hypothetical protein QG602_4173 [Verrucomicrobiota bacterium]|nr:hypothetical protein [Verrucomicrobiota bacterium]
MSAPLRCDRAELLDADVAVEQLGAFGLEQNGPVVAVGACLD